MNSDSKTTAKRIRVWDLPTRLFHWLLLLCIIGSVVSVKLGGNAMAWHFRFGYAALTLLLFRIIWGFVGTKYARFSSFLPSPSAALRYLKTGYSGSLGHNPLGALSVYALLAALLFQSASGLFANDAIMWDGPLKNIVSNSTSDLLSKLHHLNEKVLMLLIGLHIGAIAYYKLKKKERLVSAMVTGDKTITAPAMDSSAETAIQESGTVYVKAAVALLLAAALVYYIVNYIK